MPFNPRKDPPPVETQTEWQREQAQAELVERCCRTDDGREYAALVRSIEDPYLWWEFARALSQMLGVPNGVSYPNRQAKQQWLGREKERRRQLERAARAAADPT